MLPLEEEQEFVLEQLLEEDGSTRIIRLFTGVDYFQNNEIEEVFDKEEPSIAHSKMHMIASHDDENPVVNIDSNALSSGGSRSLYNALVVINVCSDLTLA